MNSLGAVDAIAAGERDVRRSVTKMQAGGLYREMRRAQADR